MPGGRSSSIPYLTMVCVCPPHTSMIVQGLVVIDRRACRSLSAAAGSRYSSRYFMGVPRLQFAEFVHALKEPEDLICFGFVNFGQGKPHVNDDVITNLDLGNVLHTHALE